MSSSMLRILMTSSCLVLLCGSVASAQDSSAVAASEPAPPPSVPHSQPALPTVEESLPSVSYLRDREGNLQPVIGFTWEEFEQLYRLKQKLSQPARQPSYSVQQISITGTAEPAFAKLTVVLQILVSEEGWVRVPLRLGQSILQEASYHGPGEQFVYFEGEESGYVCWIFGKAQQRHQLSLAVWAPLAKAGRETLLKLPLPRAVTQLNLKVPLPDVVARVSEESVLELSKQRDGESTELRVWGRGGDFQLAWRAGDGSATAARTVLEATGTVFVQIDGHSVDAEAVLEVRGQGAPFDHFRIRLPENAELIPSPSQGQRMATVDEPNAGRQTVEVRLEKSSTGPIQVRLTTRQSHNVNQPEEWFEAAAFEVVGAARQWGYIAVATVGELDVHWRLGPQLRRIEVEQLPEHLRRKDLVAGFEYFAQPCQLAGQVRVRQTRVHVEPVYLLLVDAHEARLQADLKYTVRGAKAFQLEVSVPPGWESVDVGPKHLVAVDRVTLAEGDLLSIPLIEPSTGQIDVQLLARWPIPPGTDALVLPLPQPRVGAPVPTVVAVAPADNVELTPSDEAMIGLDPQPIDPQVRRPEDRQQPLLCYRGTGGKDVFAAGFRVHPQQISAEVSGKVQLDRQTAQVEQRFSYTIRYARAGRLSLLVPRRLITSAGLEVLHEGKRLELIEESPAAVEDTGDEGGAGGLDTTVVQVALPRPQIGRCELALKHSTALQELLAGRPLPLVMPNQGELTRNRLVVVTAASIRCQPLGTDWSVEEGAAAPGEPMGVRLRATARHTALPLRIQLGNAVGHEEMIMVERVWVQTWLTEDSRQDRAVFTLRTNRKQLPLTLPAEADHYWIELDGNELRQRTTKEGRLQIAVGGGERHLLEIRSRAALARPPRGKMSIAMPQLGEKVWIQRLYWQLVLPPNEHVIVEPEGFTPEFRWGWNGSFWGREPLLDQAQLERWVGRSAESLPSRGVNAYLFSGSGRIDRLQLRTASRTWIVFFASGGTLIAGLALIFFPGCRHPGVLWIAAVVLLSAGLLQPEAALLTAQAASLGLVLSLLAGWLQRAVIRRRAGLREVGSAVLEKGSTETLHPPAGISNQLSAQALPPAGPQAAEGPNA